MDEPEQHEFVAAWPLALFAIILMATVTGVVLSWGLEPWTDTVFYAMYSSVLGAAGMVVASRYRPNPIGWLMLWLAGSNAIIGDLAQGYGLRAARHGWPGGTLGEWANSSAVAFQIVPSLVLWLVFPTGRFLSRRWIAVPVAGGVATVLAVGGYCFSNLADDFFVGGVNPYVVEWLPAQLMWVVGNVFLVAALAGAAVAVIVRFRRSEGIEAQQLKWFAFSAVIAAVVLPVAPFLWDRYPALRALTALVLLLQPLAISLAILRYRLYDIDRIISRTIGYGLVTGVLAGVYVAIVMTLGAFVGRSSVWATAGATLGAAAAFRPVRARFQAPVDRRFDRFRYDALAQIERFVEDLRAGRVEPEHVETVLQEVTGDPQLTIHFHDPQLDGVVPPVGIPVVRGDARIATVTCGAKGGTWLVADVVAAAGLAIEIAGLRVELRRQLDEVEASRARLVSVADEERRRIERDLHDGAQQRLVSIGLALRHAQHQLVGSPAADVGRTLDEAVAEIALAIDELRELANGILPSSLDGGLGPALRELAQRAPMAVTVAAPGERFAAEEEATAYFVACEALTNAIKHARASHVSLGADRCDGALVVRVADDGSGGADAHRGSGLRGLADRLAAHGGTLSVDSTGRGTTITARIPCAS